MEFRILGPLEVETQDGPLKLGPAKQRALLAVLLLHRNQVVATDRLVDEMWGEQPPQTATKTVQVYVSNLRKALGDGVLETQGRGYLLRVGPGQVDAERFEELAQDGRRLLEADPGSARNSLEEALALWRGQPLADFIYEPFAAAEVARLEEARLAVVEDKLDAELALGRHQELTGELEALVRRHPGRERLHGQLMLALYRCGRQADALRSYHSARQALMDELGLEPGRELRELEQAILAQDPALDLPGRRAPRAIAPAGGRRLGPALIAAGGVAVLAAAIAIFASGDSDNPATKVSLSANTVGRIAPTGGRVLAAVPVAGAPARVALAGRTLWVTSDDAHTLSEVDSVGLRVGRVVRAGGRPTDFALAGDAAWIVDSARGRLVKLSPDYRRVLSSSPIRGALRQAEPAAITRLTLNSWSVAAGEGSIWVTDGSQRLHRADPRTATFARSLDVADRVNAVAVGAGAVWAVSGPAARVLRIDPDSGKVTDRISVVARARADSPYPIAIEIGAGFVWVLNANTGSVTRIDPQQLAVVSTTPVGVARGPRRLAVGAGAAWVANADGTLARIDRSSGDVRIERVAPSLYDVAAGPSGVWVSAGPGIGGGSAPQETASQASVRPLPASQCEPVASRPGSRPRHLIASDMPLQGELYPLGAQATAAVLDVLRARGFRAGRFAVGYQACDDSVSAGEDAYTDRCAPNMKAYAANRSVIAVIGPLLSSCAYQQIPIANAAPAGPLAMIGPSTTDTGLTRAGPGVGPEYPDAHYPTGKRNFVRVVTPDDVQGDAIAVLARQLRLRRLFVVHENGDYGTAFADDFIRTASRLRVPVVGRAAFGQAGLTARAVQRARRARADGIFVIGFLPDPNSLRVTRLLLEALPGARMIAPDGFAVPELDDLLGPPAEGMLITVPGIAAEKLTGAGARFVRRFGRQIEGQLQPFAVYAAQSAEVVLDAIARSDGSRASVTRELFRTRIRNGILGSFSITPAGDTTSTAVTVYRVRGGRQVPDRVIRP